jgi:hypothetical protein
MANLSNVTDALVKLLELNVSRLLGGAAVTVSRIPPEKAEEAGDTRLNLYLYHVANDVDGGNDIPISPGGAFPIATRPLALKLFYVLTAHAVLENNVEDSAGQQSLMGWAMKTFHDFPVIDSGLTLSGTQIFPTIGKRVVEVILRPITPEEAISFWSTDQVRTARLSAYYEVRTLLLPPEAPTDLAGPVGSLGLNVRPDGRPSLAATSSVSRFTLPAALGGGAMAVRRSPAVVALKSGAPDPDMRLDAIGTGLGDGSDASVVLRGEPLAALGLPGNAAVLEASGNAGWNILVDDAALSLSVRPDAQATTDTGLMPVKLLPGIYSLAVRRRLVTRSEEGLERSVESESNRAQFAIAPFLLTASTNAAKHIVVTVDGAYDVQDAAAEPQLSIAGELYRLIAAFAGNPGDAGCFVARNGNIYEAAPAFDPTVAGQTYPIRLSVNGVDAAPFWMQVP